MTRQRGEPLWRLAFDLLAPMKPNDVLHYEVLCEVYDTDDLQRVHRMVGRAKKDLLTECGRTVEAIPGVGYRMIRAAEHSTQSRRHQELSRREMERAAIICEATHLDELTATQREQNMQERLLLRQMCYALDDHNDRLNEHDALIASLQRDQDELRRHVKDLTKAKD